MPTWALLLVSTEWDAIRSQALNKRWLLIKMIRDQNRMSRLTSHDIFDKDNVLEILFNFEVI